MAADLGGATVLTAGQKQLIKRCAMISVACELMEQEAMAGQPQRIAYGTLTGHLTRTLNALGLKREPIDVTPALHQYLETLQPVESSGRLVATARGLRARSRAEPVSVSSCVSVCQGGRPQ